MNHQLFVSCHGFYQNFRLETRHKPVNLNVENCLKHCTAISFCLELLTNAQQLSLVETELKTSQIIGKVEIPVEKKHPWERRQRRWFLDWGNGFSFPKTFLKSSTQNISVFQYPSQFPAFNSNDKWWIFNWKLWIGLIKVSPAKWKIIKWNFILHWRLFWNDCFNQYV